MRIHDFDTHYGIEIGDGMFMQRKRVTKATDDAMQFHESVIIALCDVVLCKHPNTRSIERDAAGNLFECVACGARRT